MTGKRFLPGRLLLPAVLVLLVAAVFHPVAGYEFLRFDDPRLVAENQAVRGGITLAALHWAFTATYFGNWMPLTWLSHLLDVEIFGLAPGGHHATSVILHAVAALLLFSLLRAMTGARWRSFAVAALFAVHPLHVEPVAWVAARRDVLSALFWFLSLLAYLRYARRPGGCRYAVVLAAYAAALMTKPMVVTLPFVLLLLDLWPLGRPRSRLLLLEKAPLLLLAAALGAVTLAAQRGAGAVTEDAQVSLAARAANALLSAAAYLRDTAWPAGLSIFYPHPGEGVSRGWAFLSAAAVAALTAAALTAFRRRPFFLVGWLWYLVILAPVIGMVQFGSHARADRFTYLPLVGIFLALSWAAGEAAGPGGPRRTAVAACSLAVLAAFLAAGRAQVAFWRSEAAVFGRAVAVDPRNWMAHAHLGEDMLLRGSPAGAEEHFRRALEERPNLAQALVGLGRAAALQDRTAEAAARYEEALRLDPDDPVALFNLGNALARIGRGEEAVDRYRRVLELDPSSAAVRNNMGNVLASIGRGEEAIASYREAIRLQPEYVLSYRNLAAELVDQGRVEEAAVFLRDALRLRPGMAEVHYILGQVLEAAGDEAGAAMSYREALRRDPGHRQASSALLALPGR